MEKYPWQPENERDIWAKRKASLPVRLRTHLTPAAPDRLRRAGIDLLSPLVVLNL